MLIPPRSVPSFPVHLHPPISGPSPRGTKAQEEQEEPPESPAPRTALCSPRYSCHICPALLGTPSGEQPWNYCSGSLSHPAPSGVFPHPGLSTWDCCRRSHGQRSLIHGAWPGSPGSHIPHISPKTALPCHGDAALGPSAGKVLAGCHSPVQKHRRLASECWSMSNLPRRAKSQDTDLQILL